MLAHLLDNLDRWFSVRPYYAFMYLFGFIIAIWMLGYAMGQNEARRIFDDIINIIESDAIHIKSKLKIIYKFIRGKND